MLDQLRCLIEYQALEDRKTRLLRDGEETPRRLAELEKDFERFQDEYVAKKAECEDFRKAHRVLEQNIADLQARSARNKQRMRDLKTNKEFQAMQKEIDETKKEVAGKEENILTLMESIEAAESELGTLDKDLQSRKAVMDAARNEAEKERSHLQGKLDRLEALQEKIREKLETDLLKRSDFLMQRQAGIAVAAVENGVCQVCHMNIPPQKFIELQRDQDILQCPHCHRFIYWPGHEGYCLPEGDSDDF